MQTCSTGVAQWHRESREQVKGTLSPCHTHLAGRHCPHPGQQQHRVGCGRDCSSVLCSLSQPGCPDSKLLLPGGACQGDLPSTGPQQLPLLSNAVLQGIGSNCHPCVAAGEGVTVSPWETAEQSRELHAQGGDGDGQGGTQTDASLRDNKNRTDRQTDRNITEEQCTGSGSRAGHSPKHTPVLGEHSPPTHTHPTLPEPLQFSQCWRSLLPLFRLFFFFFFSIFFSLKICI